MPCLPTLSFILLQVSLVKKKLPFRLSGGMIKGHIQQISPGEAGMEDLLAKATPACQVQDLQMTLSFLQTEFPGYEEHTQTVTNTYIITAVSNSTFAII